MAGHSYLRMHTLEAEHLLLDLGAASIELQSMAGDRHAVTLVREGGLSVVLMQLKAGSSLQEHAAPGPTTVQVLNGQVRVGLGDEQLDVPSGQLIAFNGGIRHTVEAIENSTLLLTLAAPPGD